MASNGGDVRPTTATGNAASPSDDTASHLIRTAVFDGSGRSGAADEEAGWEHAGGQDAPAADESAAWWRQLKRWLATLNPGRTQREYEKAVGYFFGTPGVPERLEELTFDLLLAYRGALALRATAHGELAPRPRRTDRSALRSGERTRLPPGHEADEDRSGAGSSRDGNAGERPTSPLAPATVNLRLTALRQFLVHCALSGSLPQLSPDRIRAALKRLSIERRRPYQVLAEPEWEGFLAAARLPLDAERGRGTETDGPADRAEALAAASARSPWGVPRAVRRQSARQAHQTQQTQVGDAQAQVAAEDARSRLPRSKAGLTGARTAQRDHALIALALATGLRAIELASLDVGDLSREWYAGQQEWWLILPDMKTKGQRGGRLLPLDAALMQTLLAYLAATGRRWESASDRATPLFIAGPARSTTGRARPARERGTDAAEGGKRWAPRRLSPNQIRRIVDRVETQWLALRAQGSGVSGDGSHDAVDVVDTVGETRAISPHALRHSTAIALLEGNEAAARPPASVEHVRGWLGHFDIRTTQGYLSHLEGRRHRRPFTLAPGASGKRAPAQAPPDNSEAGPAE